MAPEANPDANPESAPAALSADPSPTTSSANHKPYLHLKSQFFTNAHGRELLALPGWANVLEEYYDIRRAQIRGQDDRGLTPALLHPLFTGEDQKAGNRVARSNSTPPDSARGAGGPVLLWTLGSFNQDRRSMLLDGEALAAVSGTSALLPVLDFMFILSAAVWPNDVTELDEVFPEPEGLNIFKKMYWLIKDLI
jgi:hypothetical protein